MNKGKMENTLANQILDSQNLINIHTLYHFHPILFSNPFLQSILLWIFRNTNKRKTMNFAKHLAVHLFQTQEKGQVAVKPHIY